MNECVWQREIRNLTREYCSGGAIPAAVAARGVTAKDAVRAWRRVERRRRRKAAGGTETDLGERERLCALS